MDLSVFKSFRAEKSQIQSHAYILHNTNGKLSRQNCINYLVEERKAGPNELTNY